MASRLRLGLLGGTFDPIHRGHVDLGRAAWAATQLTGVVVLPARVPPHRPAPAAPAAHRFAMAALVVLDQEGWRMDDCELERPGPSYAIDTVRAFLRDGYAPSDLVVILGADAFAGIGEWKDARALLESATFAVVSRPGFRVTDLPARLPELAPRMRQPPFAPLPDDGPSIILIDALTSDVSSSAIRARRGARRPIAGMVDPRVQQYIERHGLYAPPGGRQDDSGSAPEHTAGRLHG